MKPWANWLSHVADLELWQAATVASVCAVVFFWATRRAIVWWKLLRVDVHSPGKGGVQGAVGKIIRDDDGPRSWLDDAPVVVVQSELRTKRGARYRRLRRGRIRLKNDRQVFTIDEAHIFLVDASWQSEAFENLSSERQQVIRSALGHSVAHTSLAGATVRERMLRGGEAVAVRRWQRRRRSLCWIQSGRSNRWRRPFRRRLLFSISAAMLSSAVCVAMLEGHDNLRNKVHGALMRGDKRK